METVVPPDITQELTQILSNLVLGDNAIRANAEKAVNERLSRSPDVYLLALAQFAIAADTELMRSFSLVLLRRLLFRPAPNYPRPLPTLYDHLPTQTLATLERLLLHSLSHEISPAVRRKTVDTISDLANWSMGRGRPWHALQALAFTMSSAKPDQVHNDNLRESAYRIFSGCPLLVMDLQTDAVLDVLSRGLRDISPQVRQTALQASISYLQACDPAQLANSISLIYPILETLSNSIGDTVALTQYILTLTPLTTSHPTLFAPHLPALLAFLPQLILPVQDWDCGPTPTVAKPFPANHSSFEFPPPLPTSMQTTSDDLDAKQTLRLTALEFMLSLSESRPSMVRKIDGWVSVLVRACLEGMGEIDEFTDDSPDGEHSADEAWCNEDVSSTVCFFSSDSNSVLALRQQLGLRSNEYTLCTL